MSLKPPAQKSTDQPAQHSEPSRGQVMQTVEAVVGSAVLGKGDRRATLLRYLVEMELAGRGQELKAFSIAVDVLGRDQSFDPNTDSIVRSEVGRLREALRLYFAEIAQADDVRIEIPKGTYRPQFSTRTPDATAQQPPVKKQYVAFGLFGIGMLVIAAFAIFSSMVLSDKTAERGPETAPSGAPYELVRIAIAPFEAAGSNANANALAFGIYSELIIGLSAYPWIAVISPSGGISQLESGTADYVLNGEAFWDDQTILTSTRLVEASGENVIWGDSQTIPAAAATIKKTIAFVASQIAFELGSIHGIAPELTKAINVANSSEDLNAYLCFLDTFAYIDAPTDRGHLALRECLLDAVAEFPTFGDGWASLGLVYLDEARFARNARDDADAWRDADSAIKQALQYAGLRMPTLNVALILSIEAPERDREAFDKFSSLLLNLYPRHPHTLNNVGSRMAEFTGQWDEGIALIREAIILSPTPPSAFFVTQAYQAALSGTDEDALSSVKMLTTTTSETQLLLNYLAAARNDLPDEMVKYRGYLAQQGLGSEMEITSHVLGRRYVPELEAALLEQLKNAVKLEPAR